MVRRAPLAVAGASFAADPAGVIYWPEQGLLAVADLHLEKGSSFAARGVLLPPYDTAATLARLAALIAYYAPRVVVALGDNFHDRRGHARLADTDRATLLNLQRGRDWVWITGNHDPEPAEGIGGRFLSTLKVGARHLPPPAGGGRLRRDRRPSASGGAGDAPWPLGEPPLLRRRRRPPGDAGVRRLCRRPQRARPRLCPGVPDADLHRAHAGRSSASMRLPPGIACRTDRRVANRCRI